MSQLAIILALSLLATLPVAIFGHLAGWAIERLTRDTRLREMAWSVGFLLTALTPPAAFALAVRPPKGTETEALAGPLAPLGLTVALAPPSGFDLGMAAWPVLLASAFGVAVWAVRQVLAARRMARTVSTCERLDDAGLDAVLVAAARRLRVPPVTLLVGDEVREPLLAGLLRPVILLPRRLASDAKPGELAAICAHELAHLARRDTLAGRLQSLAAAALCFNLPLHAITRRLADLREEACDRLALEGHDRDSRRAYAEALVSALRRTGTPQSQTAFTGQARKAAAMRLYQILNPSAPASRAAIAAALAIFAPVALAAVATTAVAAQLATAPAQTADSGLSFEADSVEVRADGASYVGDPVVRGAVPARGYTVLVDGRTVAPGVDLATLPRGIERVDIFNSRSDGDTVLIKITLKRS